MRCVIQNSVVIGDYDGHLISIAQIGSKSTEGFDLLGLIGAQGTLRYTPLYLRVVV